MPHFAASSLRGRTSRRHRNGRRDRRHLIAGLETLELRIVLNSELAQLSAAAPLFVRAGTDPLRDDDHAPAKFSSERGIAVSNIPAIRHDDRTKMHEATAAAADGDKPHRHAPAAPDKANAHPHDAHKRHTKAQPHAAPKPEPDRTRLHAPGSQHAANSHKAHAARHRRRHRSPGSTTPTSGLPIGVEPLVSGGPPVVYNESYTVFHDHALIATTAANGVLANDTDPNGYPLTAVEETGPQHGTLTLNSNGTFVYMPSPGYYGTDSFTYEAYDGYNYSSPATVSITVQETAPVASNEALTVEPDGVFNGAISATDAENDTLTATLVANPAHGTVTLNTNGSFAYTPNSGYMGSDSFSYDVSDGILTSNVATVSLSVAETAPLAGDVYYTTAENQTLTSSETSTTSVQSFTTDAQGNTLTSQVVGQPQHGTLNFAENGSFAYTPDAGFTGLDTFTYDSSDGILTSNVATAYIYVGSQSTIESEGKWDDPVEPAGTAIANDQLLNWTPGGLTDYTAEVQWGDGTESPGTVYYHNSAVGYMINGSHTYAAPGTYPITIVIMGNSSVQNVMAIFAGQVTATISDQILTAAPLTFNTHTDQSAPVEIATFTTSPKTSVIY